MIYQIQTKRAAYAMRDAYVEVRETSTREITIEYKNSILARERRGELCILRK